MYFGDGWGIMGEVSLYQCALMWGCGAGEGVNWAWIGGWWGCQTYKGRGTRGVGWRGVGLWENSGKIRTKNFKNA